MTRRKELDEAFETGVEFGKNIMSKEVFNCAIDEFKDELIAGLNGEYPVWLQEFDEYDGEPLFSKKQLELFFEMLAEEIKNQ